MRLGWKGLFRLVLKHHVDADTSRREAGRYTWLGTKAIIAEWDARSDPIGERLYADVLSVLGKDRKGTVSKIKTVALAVAYIDLDLEAYGSLNAAYNEATRRARGMETTPDPDCTCPCHHTPVSETRIPKEEA